MTSIPAGFQSATTHRRFKGKQKASESTDARLQLEQTELCQKWLWSLRQTLQCQAQHQSLLLEEFLLPPQSLPGMAFQANPPIQRIHPFTNHVPIQQRRHASNAYGRNLSTSDKAFQSSSSSNSESKPSLTGSRSFASQPSRVRPPVEHDPVELFRHYVHAAPDQFDLAACRAAFDAACRTQTPQIHPPDVQLYARQIIHIAEGFYSKKTNPEHMKDWGLAATQALLLWETPLRQDEASAGDFDHILARALALSGQLRRATRLLHSITQGHEGGAEMLPLYQVYESIILATHLHYGSGHVLNFTVLEWKILGPIFSHRPPPSTNTLRQSVFTALRGLSQPADVLQQRSDWEQHRMQTAVDLLLTVFVRTEQSSKALDIFNAAPQWKCAISPSRTLFLVRALARDEAYKDAQNVFGNVLENKQQYYLSTGLDLYGRMGDHTRAEYFFRALSTNGSVSHADRNNLLFSYARQGNVKKTEETFDRLFPLFSDSSVVRSNYPSAFAYGTVMYAYAKRDDHEGVQRWYTALQKARIAMDRRACNLVLEAFSMCGDIDSIMEILKEMRRSAHTPPDAQSYTYLVALLAHRGDPEAAERVYSRAVRDGVVPDRHLVTTLMNAHVEAGSWYGVIRAFDYLASSANSEANLSIEVFNTLLKAYVMIGSPFKIVSRVYDRLAASHAKPDEYTFALLVQSACDAGYMDIAQTICNDILDGMYDNVALNAYLLTILMAGYLRRGNKQRATETYDQFAKLGINPSSVSFNHVVRGYANERNRESLLVAEGFVSQLLDTPQHLRKWHQPQYGKKGISEHLFGPILAQYAREDKMTADTGRVFQDMLDRDIKPELGPLTSLLNAYRKSLDFTCVMELWPKILQLGLQKLNALPEKDYPSEQNDPATRVKPDLLSVPLSIYIDALSSAGQHLDVAKVWKQFQEHQLQFTSHNWNQLVVALVRAGEAERAFEVLEKVIIPYEKQAEQLASGRDLQPDSPLSLHHSDGRDVLPAPPGPEDDIEVSPEVVPLVDHGMRHQSPLHNPMARRGAVYVSNKKTEALSFQERAKERPDDHVHPLHILHDVSPSWNVWRPHLTTLSVLLVAMIKLRTGRLVKPTAPLDIPDDAEPMNPRSAVAKLRRGNRDADDEDAETAQEMLERIRKEFPQAFAYVMEHEQKEKKRLATRFERTYRV